MDEKIDVKAFVANRIAAKLPGINRRRLLLAIEQCADRNLKDMAFTLSSDDCQISLAHT